MRNITPVDTFTAPVSVLEDTDPVSESSTQPTIQALTNRTENCNTRLVALGTKDTASGVVGLDSNKHATITASGGNQPALSATGNGTGAGVAASGGATGNGITAQGGVTSGAGVVGTGTASGSVGVSGTGVGAGSGVTGQGGATGPGLTATGGASGAAGVVATGTVAQPGVSAQGGASGNGVTAAGGASGGTGVVGNGTASGATGVIGNGGSGNAIGVQGNGSGTAEGARFAGGASNGDGVRGTGGASNGIGVVGFGVGTGAGGYFDGQGDGTGASDDAIVCIQNIKMQGSNPAKTTAFNNRLTPSNLTKAWAKCTSGGAGAPTFSAGFNVASIARVDNATLLVTLAQAMADTNYVVCFGTPFGNLSYKAMYSIVNSSSFQILWKNEGTGSITDNSSGLEGSFSLFGLQ